jgi:hypothetical protein
MLYHPSCRVIAAQLPVGHAVLFLSNKLIYVVRNISNTTVLYRFVLSMTQATSSPIIPTDPHALSNLIW